jgi:hypothetical protein
VCLALRSREGARASWPRPELKIQMPRSDTADVQGWDLLVAGDLVRGEA